MNLVVALSAIFRMAAILLIVSVVGSTSLPLLGFVDPNPVELTVQGESAIWKIAGDLLPAGFLWIYASELSRWLIGRCDRPLEAGIRAAALVFASFMISSAAVSIYFLLHPIDPLVEDDFLDRLFRGSPASEAATVIVFGFSVALIFAAPKIIQLIEMRERTLRLRAKIKSEDA